MKHWKLWTAALAVLCLMFGPVPASNADEQGWGLKVQSPHVGILFLYITKQGFAIVIKETGAKFVTHAPEWRVVMYNDNSKVYYVERLSDLQVISKNGKSTKKAQEALTKTAGNVKTGRTENIGGLPATQYFINTVSAEGGTREAEVWITKSIIPPTQLHDTLRKIFNIDIRKSGIPDGLPVRIKMADEGGKRELIFDTVNAEKQKIHTASFTYPSTYKRVDSELAVLMDEKSRKKMESILDDSDDLTSILGSSASPASTKGSSTSSSSSSSSSSVSASSAYDGKHGTTSDAYKALSSAPTSVSVSTANAAKKPAQNDWWGNIVNMFTGNNNNH